MKWESRFSLGLNAAKNSHHIEKCVKQKFRGSKLKNSAADVHLYLSQEWSFAAPKISQFSNLGMGKQVHFGTEHAAKNTGYFEKCLKRNFCRIKFPAKNSSDAHLCILEEWNSKNLSVLKINIITQRGNGKISPL